MNQRWKAAALAAAFVGLGVAERALEQGAMAQRKAPAFQVDPLWPKMPRQWILGQVSGLDVDARDHGGSSSARGR
jgi:hypothetical protein